MKPIIREYLAGLRERKELDAILPDLVSELGHTVLSRPGIGTTQFGIDFASIGRNVEGDLVVYLYVIKAGDLTRADWTDGEQGVRASLEAAKDVYVRQYIPKQYRSLKVVIRICFGGDLKENAQTYLHSYTDRETTAVLGFEIWNGDLIAGLLLQGVLREEILPKTLQPAFRKAVVLVDQPDRSIHHFTALLRPLLTQAARSPKDRVSTLRQLYVALWILFVWARDADNLEAPFKASELAVLAGWEIIRPILGVKRKTTSDAGRALDQIIQLHLTITGTFLETKVLPHADTQHGLSLAVQTHKTADVNLKMFDLLGRVAMFGLWHQWMASSATSPLPPEHGAGLDALVRRAFMMIQANPTLFLPLHDAQATDVALMLMLWAARGGGADDGQTWLHEMVGRLSFTLKTHGAYTCDSSDYEDLIDHPKEATEAYRSRVTTGSTLIPLLATWLTAMGDYEALALLSSLKASVLSHCNMQLWMPDPSTEEVLYVGGALHGVALDSLPITDDGQALMTLLADQVAKDEVFAELSAAKRGMWPIVLLALRTQGLPIPPQCWIQFLTSVPAETQRAS